jgi:hypothetical protein
MGSKLHCKIVPRIVPPLAVLAFGTAFIATPALAQQPWQSNPDDQYMRSDSGPPSADSGRSYNDAPGGGNYYDYAQGPGAAPAAGSVAYCEARFHSYDPSTGMYRGFDGTMHPCP